MDVESLFTSGGESGKGVSVSVWQAEVALRLSKFTLHLVICLYFLSSWMFWTGFLRKVYGILSAQLILTVVIAGICIAVPPLKGFVQTR